jgi:streptogrisin C
MIALTRVTVATTATGTGEGNLMYHKAMRTAVVTTAVAATLVTALAGATGAAADQKAPLGGPKKAPEGSPVAAAAKAYRTAYPTMTQAAAERAARQQETRKTLHARITQGDRASTFAGAWFDAPNGTVHIAATNTAARTYAAKAGKALGLKVTTHSATRSFAQLESAATALRTSRTGLGRAAHGQVGIDVRTNSIVAAVPKASLTTLRRSSAPGVRLVAQSTDKVEADYGCTSRAACDYTIRAGSMLWRGSQGNNVCSVGFTGRQTNNQRWVYTAGHCSNGNNVTWGTGTAYIGPMYASVDVGAYDASIIRVTNPWFAYDQGGEIYQSVYANGVAPTLSYIWAGDTVCLSANYTNPTGPNFCGVVGTNSDPAVRGMVRVNGLDACGGDSGGGWYWLTSTGRRIAYGLHSRSDAGCHGDAGGSRSWFSPLPTVKAGWTPWLNVETRP